LQLLESEVTECLGLLGVDRFTALDKTYVHPAHPVVLPHSLSAFPLLHIPEEGY
jgi:hypothetical protein